MPIYCYECPEGHETEFLKLRKKEKEPKFCEHQVTRVQHRTKQAETFECGLPLTKKIVPSNWGYTKGKNPNWPQSPESDPTPLPDETVG